MLPAKNRLPLKSELERVKKEGKTFQGSLFGLIVSLGKKKAPSRFAFIVSSKVGRRAHERNRIKRLLRQAARDNLDRLEKPIDGVFLAKKAILGKSYTEVEREVVRIFEKAGRR